MLTFIASDSFRLLSRSAIRCEDRARRF